MSKRELSIVIVAAVVGLIVSISIPGLYGILVAIAVGLLLGWLSRFAGDEDEG
jgi:predicted branched-subunit amino acid permease